MYGELPLATQEGLEAHMQNLGKRRVEKRFSDAIQRGRETSTTGGRRLLRDLGGTLEKAIVEWMKEAKKKPGRRHRALTHFKLLSTRKIAVFGLKIVLDSLTRERTYAAVAHNIGRRCEDECRFQEFKKTDGGRFRGAKDRSADFSSYEERSRHILKAMSLFGINCTRWSREEVTALGTVVLELILEHCGIITAHRLKKQGKKHAALYIRPTQEVIEWMENVNERGAMMAPMVLPFVDKPLDWRGPISGGFHSTDIHQTAIVKTNSKRTLDRLIGADMPLVYDSINRLQRTAWQINPEVFEVMDHFWQMGHPIPGLPSREADELPNKPIDIAENKEARLAYRKEAREVHDRNCRRFQARLGIAKTHWVCEQYRNLPKFYFAYQLDFRGRAYPNGTFLHPQGDDLCKGVLRFAEGKPLETGDAIRWYQIHGANCFGMDKLTFDERVAWVLMNTADIIKVGEDPIENQWWMNAAEPWQFLAWCLDFFKWYHEPEHLSQIVVHQDATQSGIQIYSLLLRDRTAAKQTNVTASDRPQDLYQQVADETVRILKEAGDDISIWWTRFGIDRKCCKRPVMTRVYNATQHSCRDYVGEWAREKAQSTGLELPATDGRPAITVLADAVWAATNTVISSMSRGQDWLTECASIFAEANARIDYVSPLGFPVEQWYPRWNSICVRTSIGEKYRQTSLRVEKSEVDKKRMRQSFAPNFIHSLDAAAMMATVAHAGENGVTSLAAVHDSFGTHAADASVLARATREAYVEIFSEDRFKILSLQLQDSLPGDTLPPTPEPGDLVVSELLDSPYFFS